MFIGKYWDLLKTTAREWARDGTFRMAASLAYYTIFSMAPIMLIAISLAGLFFSRERAATEVAEQIRSLVGPHGAAAIEEIIRNLHQSKSNISAAFIGLITALIGSTAVFGELQASLNEIWDVKVDTRRGFLQRIILDRLRSFGIVLVVGFLLLVSLVLSAALSGAKNFLDERVGGFAWAWRLIHLVLSFGIVTLLFALIYRYLPDVQIKWRDVIVGAVVTSLLFAVGKWLIGLYLGRTAVGSAYGAAGSLAVLLVWVYYSSLVSFFGAEFTAVYARRYGSHIHPAEHAIRRGHKPDQV